MKQGLTCIVVPTKLEGKRRNTILRRFKDIMNTGAPWDGPIYTP